MLKDFLVNDEDDASMVIPSAAVETFMPNRQYSENIFGECLDNLPLGMVYAPSQRFENLYSPEEALCAGTLFKDLDKPWLGRKGVMK